MAYHQLPPGVQVLELHELACVCGKAPTHAVLRPVHMDGQRPTDFALHARGYCNACSKVLVPGTTPPLPIWLWPWWQRAIHRVFTVLGRTAKPQQEPASAKY